MMMSKTLFRFTAVLALLSVLLPEPGIGQTNTPLFRAYYQLQHQRDQNLPEQIHREEMLLSVGSSASTFVSYDKISQRVAKFHEIRDLMANSGEDIPTVRTSAGRIVIPQEITRTSGADEFLVTDFLVQYYTYTEPVQQIEWQIHSDSVKQILDFACTKASADFRGRRWEVWFTSDVPYPEGPWLLTGLPGLIIQAEDTAHQVKYELTALESGTEPDEVLTENDNIAEFATSNTKVTEVSKDEFFGLRVKALRNPEAYQKAQATLVMFVQDYGLLNDDCWTQKIPNPIDLTELD